MAIINIIIPAYNVEKYIRRCLDSILAQTFEEFETILIEDGSSDNTARICDEYAEVDSRIHVIHQSNRGVAAARNEGLKWAKNRPGIEWIGFIDSDDWIEADYLEKLYLTAIKSETRISTCNYSIVHNDAYKPVTVDWENDVHTGEEVYTHLGKGIFAYLWAKLFKLELWDTISFPEGALWEDSSTLWKVLLPEKRVSICNETLYFYYYNDKGIVHSLWTRNKLDHFDALEIQLMDPAIHHYGVAYERLKDEYYYSLIDQSKQIENTFSQDKTGRARAKHLLSIKGRWYIDNLLKYRVKMEDNPQLTNIAYPNKAWFYWTYKALKSKLFKE